MRALRMLTVAVGLLAMTASPVAAQPAVLKPTPQAVASVLDGDTIRLASGQDVRLVGIDAPDHGDCGFERAQSKLVRLIGSHRVTLVAPVQNKDQYGRLLRYAQVGTKDLGLKMIRAGLAVARYDSRDGFRRHPRENLYHRVDDATPDLAC